MELWSAVQRENPEPGLLLGLWFSRRSPFRRAAAQTLEPYDGGGPRSPVSSEGSGAPASDSGALQMSPQ
ncbi:unnamed protein product [Gadus morhua 'NCC']